MELSDKERLMLVEKKDEILKLTLEILDILSTEDPKQATVVKKKMTTILSLISTIASYADSKNYNLQPLWNVTNLIFAQMDLLRDHWTAISPYIEIFCNTVNHIQFNFSKRDLKIRIPKINLSLHF